MIPPTTRTIIIVGIIKCFLYLKNTLMKDSSLFILPSFLNTKFKHYSKASPKHHPPQSNSNLQKHHQYNDEKSVVLLRYRTCNIGYFLGLKFVLNVSLSFKKSLLTVSSKKGVFTFSNSYCRFIII